jgi:hypothetical protein
MAELLDVTIYDPNPAVAAVLISPRMRAIVFEVAELAQALYVAQVAKRSGMLAASAHASTEIGGQGRRTHDRWIGQLTVGGTGSLGTVDYGAAHEFGRGEHAGSIHDLDGEQIVQHPAHDLNRVLEELGGL